VFVVLEYFIHIGQASSAKGCHLDTEICEFSQILTVNLNTPIEGALSDY